MSIKGKYLVGIFILGLICFLIIVWLKQLATTGTSNKPQTDLIENRDSINEAGLEQSKAIEEKKSLRTSLLEMNGLAGDIKVDEALPINKSTFLSEYYNEDAVALMKDNLDVNLIENILKRQDNNELSITKENEILDVLYNYENEGRVSVDNHYCSVLGCVVVYRVFPYPDPIIKPEDLLTHDEFIDKDSIFSDKDYSLHFNWDISRSLRSKLNYDSTSAFGKFINNSQTNILLIPFTE